jgi:hypothetical protein
MYLAAYRYNGTLLPDGKSVCSKEVFTMFVSLERLGLNPSVPHGEDLICCPCIRQDGRPYQAHEDRKKELVGEVQYQEGTKHQR